MQCAEMLVTPVTSNVERIVLFCEMTQPAQPPHTQPFILVLDTFPMNDEFDALVHQAFYSLMEFRPDFATIFGLHQYDKKMPSGTRESELTFITSLSDYLEKFQSFDGTLSPEKQIERDIMVATLKYHLFNEKVVAHWEKDPDPVETIGFSMMPLFSREFAPFEERMESITARTIQFPRFIEEFKSRITAPVKLWVDMAKEACGSLPFFFQIILYSAKEKGLDTTDLEEAAAKTGDAISRYVEWLDQLPCEGVAILGRERFEKLLEVRELGLTAQEILHIGETYLKSEKEKLKALVQEIIPSASVGEVRNHIRSDHPPTFQDTLREYEKAIARVRDIVRENGFATIPEGERLVVQETPPFMRHIVPLAAYFGPAKFEKEKMGIYFVTPYEGASLAEHNYASIVNTSIHEAYPGHHLQMTWANKNPSLVRVLCDAPEFAEGWAHYCEERMQDYGLRDPRVQVVQTIEVIFRAVRIIIDVKLHSNEMSFDKAVSFLESETGMEHSVAVAEVKRYTKTPAYPLSYLLGKHLLLELEKEVKAHMKGSYSDRAFHDTLLGAGAIPFTYLRRELTLKGML